jgi:hypothetical protein
LGPSGVEGSVFAASRHGSSGPIWASLWRWVLYAGDRRRWDGQARATPVTEFHRRRRSSCGWHGYWRTPGDAGIPPIVDENRAAEFKGPAGDAIPAHSSVFRRPAFGLARRPYPQSHALRAPGAFNQTFCLYPTGGQRNREIQEVN